MIKISYSTALFALTLPAAAQTVDKACPPSIQDQSEPGSCVVASTLPTPGALLPLGPELFVEPTGEVGIGTMSPACTLDVAGDMLVQGRAAFGNRGAFGPAQWGSSSFILDWMFDFSHEITDFEHALGWTPMRSRVFLNPDLDLTGPDEKYIYSHDLTVQTTAGSDKDFHYIQAPYILGLHEGTGNVNLLGGVLLGAENNHGSAKYMGASYMVSICDHEASADRNACAEFQSGHWGTQGVGSIQDDYSAYIFKPYTDSPLVNHYGLFMEDQDVGLQDSYAIYSMGGAVYFEGDLGLGTDTPQAKLDVDGDFVASGTKSFVQQHPFDATKEIRFVCLEGNEAGTYFRGRAELVNGEAVIQVPEDFALVSEKDGLTVQLTPYGPGADLWVAERGLDRVVVRGARDVEFDYFVNGVRSGYSEFQTIRSRAMTLTNAAADGVRSPESEASRAMRMDRLRDGR